MVMLSRLDSRESPDSVLAEELRRARLGRPFTSRLEAEYVRSQLISNRTLIRLALGLAILLTVLRGVEQTITGAWEPIRLSCFALTLASSTLLIGITYRAGFERLYLPWARIVVPLRNAIIAAQIVSSAAQGQPDLLMVLPLLLIAPFFFLGLQSRGALMCGVLTITAAGASALFCGLAPPLVMRSGIFQIIVLLACVVAARQLEKTSRAAYLDNRLTAEMAQCDALTGAKNRRVFDDHLTSLWQRGLEDRRNIAILLLDVDHFKKYNDCYGHQAGDHALRQVARTAQAFVRRPLDVFTRYGGEEFAAILYDVDGDAAASIADQIRCAVEALAIEHVGSPTSKAVTISAGVAVVKPTGARNCRGALQLADQALYQAKLEGRNRVKTLDETQYRLLVTGSFAKHIARLPRPI